MTSNAIQNPARWPTWKAPRRKSIRSSPTPRPTSKRWTTSWRHRTFDISLQILRNLPQKGDYVEVINLSSVQPSKHVSRTTKDVVACQQVSDVTTSLFPASGGASHLQHHRAMRYNKEKAAIKADGVSGASWRRSQKGTIFSWFWRRCVKWRASSSRWTSPFVRPTESHLATLVLRGIILKKKKKDVITPFQMRLAIECPNYEPQRVSVNGGPWRNVTA